MNEEEKNIFESEINQMQDNIMEWVNNMKSKYGKEIDYYFETIYSDELIGIGRDMCLEEVKILVGDNNNDEFYFDPPCLITEKAFNNYI